MPLTATEAKCTGAGAYWLAHRNEDGDNAA